MRSPSALHALLVILVLSVALPAAAQVQEVEMPPSEVAARGHFLMGSEHYQAARFVEAAAEFRQAYDLSHRPELFYNIFLAERDAGHAREAAVALRQYVEAVPDAPQIEVLRGRLTVLEGQLAEEDARERAALEQAQSTDSVATTTTRASEPDRDGDLAPWIVIGAGGALAIGAVVTGVLTASTYGELSSSCPGNVCPAGYDVEGRRSMGTALALTTDVLGGLAAATLAAGIVWEIVDASGTDESHAGLSCTPLLCRGRF